LFATEIEKMTGWGPEIADIALIAVIGAAVGNQQSYLPERLPAGYWE
jgi:hypothetical protein